MATSNGAFGEFKGKLGNLVSYMPSGKRPFLIHLLFSYDNICNNRQVIQII